MLSRRDAVRLGIGVALGARTGFAWRNRGGLASSLGNLTEDERMRWWEEARFGLFLHWGLYSVAAGDWNGRPAKGAEHFMLYERIPNKEYAKLAAGLTLSEYDPEQWVIAAKQAGMKYLVITAKHHEGFAMFDSPSNAYNIVTCSPYGKDPMKPLAKACHKHGMKMCFYYSLGRDWQDPDVPTNWPVKGGRSNTWDYPNEDGKVFSKYFRRKVLPQVSELLTQYGPVGVMWFDTPETISRDESIELKALIRKLQPACIIDSRIGNDQGDFTVAEQHLDRGTPSGPWEACMTMSKNWGYNKHDQNYKTPEVLVRDLIEVVSAGGNLLLDTGPTAQGTLTPKALEDMKRIGAWMAENGEAIYGTHPWIVRTEEIVSMKPATSGAAITTSSEAAAKDAVNDATPTQLLSDLRFVAKGEDVFVFARSWHQPTVTVKTFAAHGIGVKSVELLGYKKPVLWMQEKDQLKVELPKDAAASIPVLTLRVTLRS